MFIDALESLRNYITNITSIDLVQLVKQSSLIVTDSVQEVFLKQDYWNSKLEVNIFVLFCTILLLEALIFVFVWRKYAAKIHTVRSAGKIEIR